MTRISFFYFSKRKKKKSSSSSLRQQKRQLQISLALRDASIKRKAFISKMSDARNFGKNEVLPQFSPQMQRTTEKQYKHEPLKQTRVQIFEKHNVNSICSPVK